MADTISVTQASKRSTTVESNRDTVRKLLLGGGIVGPLVYGTTIALAPMQWQSFSSASQAVSELAAVNAPSRPVFTSVSVLTGLLGVGFGVGVYLSARRGERAMRVSGILLAASASVGIPLQPFFPMHMRGDAMTISDTMHLVVVGLSTPLTLVAMGFAAAALTRKLRIYTILSLVATLVFGGLSGMDAPKVEAGLPTPWLGTTERISFAAYYVWAVVLALVLLRRQTEVEEATAGTGPDVGTQC